MKYGIYELLSLSILIAAVISIFRFKKSDSSYFPFLLLLWIGSANEILSVVLIHFHYHTAVNNNIYVLFESVLILVLFRSLGTTLRNRTVFRLVVLSYVVIWVFENFLVGSITTISSYFRIYYSFVTVMLSINTINYTVFYERKSLVREPVFLICVCFISFFIYKILVESFWLYGLYNSTQFRNQVYTILVYLNLLVNLVFALVTLWIPRKQEYILLS